MEGGLGYYNEIKGESGYNRDRGGITLKYRGLGYNKKIEVGLGYSRGELNEGWWKRTPWSNINVL